MRAGALTTVLRQPRLRRRQSWPWASTWTWPISPAAPAKPRCRRSPVQVLAQGDAGARAVGGADAGGVPEVPARAEAALGEGAEVGVVSDEHRDAEALGHHLGDGGVVPAAEDAGHGDGACRGVDRGGEADADADAEKLVEAGADALEAGVGAVLVGKGGGPLDEDLVSGVGGGDAHGSRADVDVRREARAVERRDEHGAAAVADRGLDVDVALLAGARTIFGTVAADRPGGRRARPG